MRSLGDGVLCLVTVAGATICVIIRHVHRGAVQVEVTAARTTGRKATDGGSTPAQEE